MRYACFVFLNWPFWLRNPNGLPTCLYSDRFLGNIHNLLEFNKHNSFSLSLSVSSFLFFSLSLIWLIFTSLSLSISLSLSFFHLFLSLFKFPYLKLYFLLYSVLSDFQCLCIILYHYFCFLLCYFYLVCQHQNLDIWSSRTIEYIRNKLLPNLWSNICTFLNTFRMNQNSLQKSFN